MVAKTAIISALAEQIVEHVDGLFDGIDNFGIKVTTTKSVAGGTIVFSHESAPKQHVVHLVAATRYPVGTIKKTDDCIVMPFSRYIGEPVEDFDVILKRCLSKTANLMIMSVNVDSKASFEKFMKLATDAIFSVADGVWTWAEASGITMIDNG